MAHLSVADAGVATANPTVYFDHYYTIMLMN